MANDSAEQAGALVNALIGLMRAGRALATRAGAERRATSTPTAVLKSVNAGCTRSSDIATSLQIDLSVVSRAITVLDGEGLITRTPDPHDARAQVLSITDAGRERIELLRRIYVELAAELLSEWTPQEIDEAARILTRLSETLRGENVDDFPARLERATALTSAASDRTSPSDPSPSDTAADSPTSDIAATLEPRPDRHVRSTT